MISENTKTIIKYLKHEGVDFFSNIFMTELVPFFISHSQKQVKKSLALDGGGGTAAVSIFVFFICLHLTDPLCDDLCDLNASHASVCTLRRPSSTFFPWKYAGSTYFFFLNLSFYFHPNNNLVSSENRVKSLLTFTALFSETFKLHVIKSLIFKCYFCYLCDKGMAS